MKRKMYGTVHDATRCTFDGRECWVASITNENGRGVPDFARGFLESCVGEFGTRAEGLAAMEAEAERRGMEFSEVPS